MAIKTIDLAVDDPNSREFLRGRGAQADQRKYDEISARKAENGG